MFEVAPVQHLPGDLRGSPEELLDFSGRVRGLGQCACQTRRQRVQFGLRRVPPLLAKDRERLVAQASRRRFVGQPAQEQEADRVVAKGALSGGELLGR